MYFDTKLAPFKTFVQYNKWQNHQTIHAINDYKKDYKSSISLEGFILSLSICHHFDVSLFDFDRVNWTVLVLRICLNEPHPFDYFHSREYTTCQQQKLWRLKSSSSYCLTPSIQQYYNNKYKKKKKTINFSKLLRFCNLNRDVIWKICKCWIWQLQFW